MELSKFIRDYFQNDFDSKKFGREYTTTIGDLHLNYPNNQNVSFKDISDSIHAIIESGGIFSFLINSNGFYFPATQAEF